MLQGDRASLVLRGGLNGGDAIRLAGGPPVGWKEGRHSGRRAAKGVVAMVAARRVRGGISRRG